MGRRYVAALLAAPLAALLTLAACGSGDDGAGGAGGGGAGDGTTTTGTFTAYADGATAVTYDPALVPAGATANVTVGEADGTTTVILSVAGLEADRGYGAHLHTKPCGATGDAAGPHHQHVPDPAASVSPPSVDPAYANPDNEVWLDLTTDGTGAASVTAVHDWTFPADRRPRSLVLHAQPTKTGPGEAGTAGARVACLTLAE